MNEFQITITHVIDRCHTRWNSDVLDVDLQMRIRLLHTDVHVPPTSTWENVEFYITIYKRNGELKMALLPLFKKDINYPQTR